MVRSVLEKGEIELGSLVTLTLSRRQIRPEIPFFLVATVTCLFGERLELLDLEGQTCFRYSGLSDPLGFSMIP